MKPDFEFFDRIRVPVDALGGKWIAELTLKELQEALFNEDLEQPQRAACARLIECMAS